MVKLETYIYLVACAMNKTPAKLEKTDLEELYDTAREHNQVALVAKALEETEAFKSADKAVRGKWQNTLNTSVKRTMLFDAERRVLIGFMEKNGIWYVPLKGILINPLYPGYGTREYSDNDFLYDASKDAVLKEYMLGRGYHFKDADYIVDAYIKEPYFNFEMHRELFRLDLEGQYNFYYKNVREKLIKDEGNAYGYHMSDSDFYIYFILHAYKHFKEEGTGFRTVADEYAILRYGTFDIDYDYVKRELEELNAYEFEQTLRSMAFKLFSDPQKTGETLAGLSDEETGFVNFVYSCGAYGHFENFMLRQMDQMASRDASKGKYYLKRLFPSVERYKYSHPFVYKHKVVYPAFWVYRLFAYPVMHRKALKREYKTITKIKKEQKNSNTSNGG